MKTAALIFTGMACALTGKYFSFALSRRVELLEKIQIMISAAENQLRYLSMPSGKIIGLLAVNSQLDGLEFLKDCEKKLSAGADFRTAWKESLSDRRNIRFLKKDETELLLSFGEMFGTTDTAGQVANCGLHSALLKDKLSEARSSRDKFSSLSTGLGAAAGIGIIIIFM